LRYLITLTIRVAIELRARLSPYGGHNRVKESAIMDRRPLDCISVRSQQIWEREGRPSGHESEFMDRARAEIEAEWRVALHDETGAVVPPHLPISQRPVRRSV
jgi:hypothetical protein